MFQLFCFCFCFCYLISCIYCCAPYFNTTEWKAKERIIGTDNYTTTECLKKYSAMANSTKVTGEDQCTKIFAGKLFCLKRCNSECQPLGEESNSDFNEISCGKFDIKGKGEKPSELHFQCFCTFFNKESNNDTKCVTKFHSWEEVESEYMDECYNVSNNASIHDTTLGTVSNKEDKKAEDSTLGTEISETLQITSELRTEFINTEKMELTDSSTTVATKDTPDSSNSPD